MGWYKQHSSFSENLLNKPVIDRCINCGDQAEVRSQITMEFGEGNYNTGPICKDCWISNHEPKTIQI